jgi:outer membrane protein TolC
MLDSLYSYALTSHPEILKYQFKLKQYDIERRLAQEMLKPDLRLNYYPLFYSDFSGTGTDNYLLNNYKYGVNFYFPLFLRKERGKLGLTNAKITSMNYEMDQAGRDIQNTVKVSWNELNNIYELVGIQKNSVSYSVTLRNGEEEKFRMGESSFFLLNTRERNLLESELKLVELQAKYAKAGLTLEWSSGRSIFSNYIK